VAKVLDLAAQGIVRPPVAGLLPLREAARAHRMMESGEATRGRLMLLPE
jgi:NADPH:quinone reductase-like Zn-dependent oxidoreductase